MIKAKYHCDRLLNLHKSAIRLFALSEVLGPSSLSNNVTPKAYTSHSNVVCPSSLDLLRSHVSTSYKRENLIKIQMK